VYVPIKQASISRKAVEYLFPQNDIGQNIEIRVNLKLKPDSTRAEHIGEDWIIFGFPVILQGSRRGGI
jgi:hypothetical protein